MNTPNPMQKLIKRFVIPHWKWYASGTFALAITNYIMLEIPDRSKHVINGLVDSENLSELEVLVISIILLGFFQMLVRALSRILLFWPGRKIESEIKDFYFFRFMKLPSEFLKNFGMGDLISRLANDVNHIRVCFAFAALQIINLTFLTIFTINKMVTVHWQLTLFSLLPISFMVIVTKFGIPRLHKYSLASQERLSELTNHVTEAFVNVHVIQINGAKESFIDRIAHSNNQVFEADLKHTVIRTIIFPAMILFTGISYVVVLFYGGLEVTKGRLTVGDIMAFNVYIGFLIFPLTAVGIVIAILQRAKAAAARLTKLEENEIENGDIILPDSTAQSSSAANPILEIKNLTYVFHDGENNEQLSSTTALSKVSLLINEGDRIGLVGEVGSGKSTLFNLMTRIIAPPENTIFWNGIDILEIDPQSLRKKIGYATQQVHLFSDSVRENLIMGIKEDISEDDIILAAEKAQILEDIIHLPKKWDTEIGEKGVRLSGGQKQRLALARIFIRNPEVYLLDDVTSALDHQTEQQVINYIHQTNKTLIIASHRSSALQKCHKIILFSAGKIKDVGTYDQLKIKYPNAFLSE